MPYAPAKGFPDWFSPDTPAQDDDAARPIRWLVVSARGLHVTRSLEATQPKQIVGWTFDDDNRR